VGEMVIEQTLLALAKPVAFAALIATEQREGACEGSPDKEFVGSSGFADLFYCW
jgi:hypothetical protein